MTINGQTRSILNLLTVKLNTLTMRVEEYN